MVGFVGLGVMGGPMAWHLLRKGHDLAVWNRTIDKAMPIGREGARLAESPEHLGALCETVAICVNRTEDVRDVLERLTKQARPGTLFIDHSTIAPNAAVAMHGELAQAGFRFLDAPVTGGSMGARKGELTVFAGGDADAFETASPTVGAYAKRFEHVGGPGAGQTMKVANQVAVGGALLALCEALAYAQKAGLELAQTRELLASGAAGSWAFDNYGPKVVSKDWSPGFSITNQRKDFRYALDSARSVGAVLPGTELVDRLLAKLDEAGHGDWTTAALFEVLSGEARH